jgi:hypothetical protein
VVQVWARIHASPSGLISMGRSRPRELLVGWRLDIKQALSFTLARTLFSSLDIPPMSVLVSAVEWL